MITGDILTGGGAVGLVAVAGYVMKQIFDAWQAARTGDVAEKSTSVTDAATANAVILGSLKALGDENVRLRLSVRHLEEESVLKDTKIRELETKLGDALAQIQGIAEELSALKST